MDIRNCDCFDLLSTLKDGSVDAVITDPPYGTTANKWDTVVDMELLFKEYHRVLKTNGVIVMFSQLPFMVDCINANRKNFRYEWVWDKIKGTGFLNSKKMPLKSHENVLIFYKKLPTYNPQKTITDKLIHGNVTPGRSSSNYGKQRADVPAWEEDGTRYPVDIIKFKRDGDRLHPTQKPIQIIEYMIKTYTNKMEVILDTFLGSGTTAVACKNTGREFIGCDINKEYYDMALERVENIKPNLFK